jgi:hypothetical protein
MVEFELEFTLDEIHMLEWIKREMGFDTIQQTLVYLLKEAVDDLHREDLKAERWARALRRARNLNKRR